MGPGVPGAGNAKILKILRTTQKVTRCHLGHDARNKREKEILAPRDLQRKNRNLSLPDKLSFFFFSSK